ncbi:uridine kinase family protein [Mucilaginibacter auburnensis]|uniref:Uridine kinase n=1 Tax=Mucilaginibacter auburnensis TaxID=1457233 RepID=A0A2H9VVB3_9SPHI|nr:uridine kinase [Mucilaginibacter auburnensis]PJJ84764.1 uridine kinase [Mucilaginibacter auburnensis]
MSKPYIIGIAGGSGSGKTFFLNRFLDHFTTDEVCLVSQDDYYIPVAHNMTPEENKLYNFDLPRTIDADAFERDVQQLINGKVIYKKEYTFNNPNATPKMLEIKPAPILIIEGLFIMHFKGIAELMDMKVFVDADEAVALERRLKRDLLERGYSNDDVMYKWIHHVVPAYNEYLLPYKEECHKIIINNTNTTENIEKVTEEISVELRRTVFGE